MVPDLTDLGIYLVELDCLMDCLGRVCRYESVTSCNCKLELVFETCLVSILGRLLLLPLEGDSRSLWSALSISWLI